MPLDVETFNLWDYVLVAHILSESCNLAFEACGEGYVQIYQSYSFHTKAVKVDNIWAEYWNALQAILYDIDGH